MSDCWRASTQLTPSFLQDILRVLFPHALEKELAEMLTVVTRRKQVKGQDNLEQQMSELKEVFAVYDDDQTGELEQAAFVEALMSAGQICHMPASEAADNGGAWQKCNVYISDCDCTESFVL